MHTPEQAKQLWCPMVRAARWEKIETDDALRRGNIAVVGGCNSGPMASMAKRADFASCIADQCAMWREVVQLHPAGELPPAPRGYCGLAGRPN